MHQLNKDKVYVNYRDDYAYSDALIPRRYTLTHSDETAELFLNVGTDYARDKITTLRDEVLGEWMYEQSTYVFYAYVLVDGKTEEETAKRNQFFRQELPLALQAIHYGDSHIFNYYPELEQATIIVHFQSKYPNYSAIENYQTFANYPVQIRYPRY